MFFGGAVSAGSAGYVQGKSTGSGDNAVYCFVRWENIGGQWLGEQGFCNTDLWKVYIPRSYYGFNIWVVPCYERRAVKFLGQSKTSVSRVGFMSDGAYDKMISELIVVVSEAGFAQLSSWRACT